MIEQLKHKNNKNYSLFFNRTAGIVNTQTNTLFWIKFKKKTSKLLEAQFKFRKINDFANQLTFLVV